MYVPYATLSLGDLVYPADQFPVGTLIHLKCGCIERIARKFDSGSVRCTLKVTCSPDHVYQFGNKKLNGFRPRLYYRVSELTDKQFYILPYKWDDDHTIFNREI